MCESSCFSGSDVQTVVRLNNGNVSIGPLTLCTRPPTYDMLVNTCVHESLFGSFGRYTSRHRQLVVAEQFVNIGATR
eukprot:m.46108 g.46108  ORF g.46108 m.46108 type:complete len:77 (-) comp15339_c0_seq1:713-943(-)